MAKKRKAKPKTYKTDNMKVYFGNIEAGAPFLSGYVFCCSACGMMIDVDTEGGTLRHLQEIHGWIPAKEVK